jgi:hypothetical protein
MAGRIGWTGGSRLGFLCLAATLLASPVSAQATPAPGTVSRLRAVDKKAAVLLRSGVERSATFRGITEAIESSDLVVYVETRPLILPSQLQFVSATPTCRYLRISVRPMGLDTELIPWLAHELWHAVEIAAEPDVRSQADLVDLYARIGSGFRSGSGVLMETVAAQETQQIVLDELRGRKRRRDP